MTPTVLLFIPGTICTAALFKLQLDYLSKLSSDLTVEVLEFSQESSLEEMTLSALNVIDDRPFILAGFSMGGFVIFDILRKLPAGYMGSILINSNCHPDLSGRKEMRLAHLDEARKTGIRILIKDKYLCNYLVKSDAQSEQIILDMADKCGLNVFEKQLNVLASRPDSLETLKSNKHPLLIIGGVDDMICPAEHQRLMAVNAPMSEVHLIDQCAHFSLLEQPKKVNELITSWLTREFNL